MDSGVTFVGSNLALSTFPFCHPTTHAPCGTSSITTSDDTTPTVCQGFIHYTLVTIIGGSNTTGVDTIAGPTSMSKLNPLEFIAIALTWMALLSMQCEGIWEQLEDISTVNAIHRQKKSRDLRFGQDHVECSLVDISNHGFVESVEDHCTTFD